VDTHKPVYVYLRNLKNKSGDEIEYELSKQGENWEVKHE